MSFKIWHRLYEYKPLHSCARVIFMMLLCAATAGKADAQNANTLFTRLRDKINTVHDYTADVRIKMGVTYMRVPTLAGRLYFKAPGKLRLERTGGLSILPKKNINLTLNSLLPNGNASVIDGGFDTVQSIRVHVIKVIPEGESDIVLAKLWIDEGRLLALRTETTTRDNGTVRTELEWGRYISLPLPDRVTFILDVKDYKLPKGATMDYDDGSQVVQKTPTGKGKKGSIQITYLDYQVNKGISDAVFDRK